MSDAAQESSASLEARPARPRRARPGRRRWTRLRLALAALALMMLLWLLALVKVTHDRVRDAEADARFPLPAQAAAIVELVERAPAEERRLVLSAVNSPDLKVAYQPHASPPKPDDSLRLRDVERVLERYLEALGERPIAVYIAVPEDARELRPRIRFGRRDLVSEHPLRMDIGLIGGGLLRLETQGDLARRVYNWPLGIGAGILSVLLAGFALWTLWRETRPLGALGERLDAFAGAARPEPMEEKGPQEVRGVIAAFNRMQGRVAELLATRSAMIGALGHDLRTYLTRLRLRIELIADEDQRARAERDLAEMGDVLENALAFARLDAAALEREPVDLVEIAEAALGGEAAALEAKGAVEGAVQGAVQVLGDRAGLRRVLDNLIANARRHGGGVARVTIAREGDHVRCAVADHGPGFPPEPARARLLEPFMRGDAARTLDRPGSGLGLAIAARLVRAMGGEIILGGWEGGGEVVLHLPAAGG